jgi:hypothetical protein
VSKKILPLCRTGVRATEEEDVRWRAKRHAHVSVTEGKQEVVDSPVLLQDFGPCRLIAVGLNKGVRKGIVAELEPERKTF